MSKLIAMTGAPNSGKTSLSIQLGLSLAAEGYSVLLVHCAGELPPKEYLFKRNTDDSLGQLLCAVELSEKMLLQGTTLINENLGVLGYNKGETAKDYPAPTQRGLDQFLDEIERLADYIIFDMQGKEDALFAKIKERDGCAVTVLKPNLKSIAWATHNSGFWADIAVLNDYQKGQVFDTEFTTPPVIVPHSKELHYNFETLCAFQPIKHAAFQKALAQLKEKVQ